MSTSIYSIPQPPESVIRAIVRRTRGASAEQRGGPGRVQPAWLGWFRHFGSWRNALQAAGGIKPAEVERRRQWDKATVSPIYGTCAAGDDLRPQLSYIDATADYIVRHATTLGLGAMP